MSDNPPAFPQHVAPAYRQEPEIWGMSLRDYFAAKAMAAIISKIPFQEFPEDWSPYEKTAIGAYDYADAMLAYRAKAGGDHA